MTRPPGQPETAPDTLRGMQTTLRFLHLLAAAVWIGGQATLLVAAPVVRAQVAEPGRLLGTIGRRFGLLAGPALLVLLVTGLLQADHYGVRAAHPFTGEFSRIVTEKLILLVLIVILTGVHGVLGARVARGVASERLRRAGRRLSAANLALGVVALWLAADLAT
jgi:putative copper export protein